MRLIELLGRRHGWHDDDTTIYVEQPWSCEADAILVSPSPQRTDPVEQEGRTYDYFLETFTIGEVLGGQFASEKDFCERLIRYAIDDA
jgi:hypothetical protein